MRIRPFHLETRALVQYVSREMRCHVASRVPERDSTVLYWRWIADCLENGGVILSFLQGGEYFKRPKRCRRDMTERSQFSRRTATCSKWSMPRKLSKKARRRYVEQSDLTSLPSELDRVAFEYFTESSRLSADLRFVCCCVYGVLVITEELYSSTLRYDCESFM